MLALVSCKTAPAGMTVCDMMISAGAALDTLNPLIITVPLESVTTACVANPPVALGSISEPVNALHIAIDDDRSGPFVPRASS
jgi:hypothetical protein